MLRCRRRSVVVALVLVVPPLLTLDQPVWASDEGATTQEKVRDRLLLCLLFEADRLDDKISDASTISNAVVTACSDCIRMYRDSLGPHASEDDIREIVRPKALESVLVLRSEPLSDKRRARLKSILDDYREFLREVYKQ